MLGLGGSQSTLALMTVMRYTPPTCTPGLASNVFQLTMTSQDPGWFSFRVGIRVAVLIRAQPSLTPDMPRTFI